ncbi:MAG: nucleotidyltransferase domain-containing protein [Bacilli bacterium]|nr:nucleotidyltransferase domain-containing protein [Bacilli bacterium]
MNDEVFERYKEETDILSDDKSELVIIYGSRATEDYENSSDLDILVVVPGEDGHLRREKRFIDGIPVETIFLSKSTLMKKIKEEYWINSKFLESALTTGTVKKSLNGIYISALDEIKRLSEIKKDKQSFSIYWAEELDKILYQYRHSEGNEKNCTIFCLSMCYEESII